MHSTIGPALVTLALALGAFATGCGADEDPAPPASGPLVVFERSGGIAGSAERLVIEADGAATLSVGLGLGKERLREFELSDASLDRLEDELAAAELEQVEPAPPNSICADCFSYSIAHGGETASWDDLAELPASVEALSVHLFEIVSANYPPGDARIESNS